MQSYWRKTSLKCGIFAIRGLNNIKKKTYCSVVAHAPMWKCTKNSIEPNEY